MGMGRPATAGVRGAGSFNSAATISVACRPSDENGRNHDMMLEQWLLDDEQMILMRKRYFDKSDYSWRL